MCTMNSCDTRYIVGSQMLGQSQNAKLGHLEPLCWYQIKILTDLIWCVLCYTVLIQVHTPITQLQFGNYYHTSNSHERMGISEEALQVCAVYKKSYFLLQII